MKLTYYGHSCFKFSVGQSVVMIDPFLSGNPLYDGTVEDAASDVTHVVLTHGHDDHILDAKQVCEITGATLIAVFEICTHLGVEKYEPANTGGTIYQPDFNVSFVRADHSSSSNGVYLGNPCGLVFHGGAIESPLYHMGDTDIFSDMALINEIYKPKIGLVPIGDRFTMNPITAAMACERYFDFATIVPCHYKTFPLLIDDAAPFVTALGKKGSTVKVMNPLDVIDV